MSSWLAEAIRAESRTVRFDRFMEVALYDPVHGCSRVEMETVGRRGDFSTSATLDASLGRALAHWIRAEARALRLAHPTIIELGSETGQLAHTILRRFRPWEKLRYYVVDVRTRNRRSRRIKRFNLVSEALKAADGIAILFSNEFVDAFPCRRFVRTESCWYAIWTARQEDHSPPPAIPPLPTPAPRSLLPPFR